MKLQGIYKNSTFAFQLSVLLFLILAGSIIAGLLQITLDSLVPVSYEQKIRMSQAMASICMFLFPAISAAFLFGNNIPGFLSMEKANLKTLFLAAVCIVFLSPVIQITTILNQQMALPGFLEPVEAWMKAQENEINQLTKQLVTEPGTVPFICNMLVMAVLAGITEEFLFRGTLQRILGNHIRNHHLVIWITALIFSAVHLQFYGLVPRMLLGAYLGYLLYWSGSIYVPVFAHFTNNALSILFMSHPSFSDNKFFSEESSLSEAWIPGGIGLFLFLVCIRGLKKKE